MNWVDVIKKPLLTEKSYSLRGEENKKYVFEVNKNANKYEISLAFQMIYNVVPEKINIVNRKPTAVRTGTRKPGMSKHKKIAYITLAKGVDIVIDTQETTEQQLQAKKAEKENKVKEVKIDTKDEKKAKSVNTLTKVVKTSPKSK